VLVVDDDLAMCGFLRSFLGARNYNALTVTNADEAVRRFHAERPAAVLLDVVMPGSMDGLAALAAFKKIDKDVPIIVISGQGRTSVVVQAMRLGATDFLCKPFEENELEVVIEKALKQHQLSQEVATLRAQLKEQSRYTMLFGHSRQMHEVRDLIERVSDTDVTVLIRGESGVGKELVARALHEQSLRKDKPFVKVNCAALPTELLESELFGFEKGAFTGAIQHKPGKFEFANHGTMFLDEIGDMSFPLQAKLLQALQDGEFSRLGGKSDVRVDVRVITATNCDLENAVAAGKFREDLYFRLNVVPIFVPPLRERVEDVPLLADHFMAMLAREYGRRPKTFEADAVRALQRYSWPGNVRELRNLVERLMIMVPGDRLSSRDLLFLESGPAAASLGGLGASRASAMAPLHEARDEFEKQYILRALAAQQGNMSRTAEVLGVERSNLYRKMRAFGIMPARRAEEEEGA
jgi:two-component system nitrogen regulation response regulator NtrX